MEIPSGPQALTAKWLTCALRETGTINQSNVKSFGTAALGKEQGVTGQLIRINLSYDTYEHSAPRSLIAKFPSTNPELREFIFTVSCQYEREVLFYEKIASRVKLRTPRCYYGALSVKAREYVLLLEDLAPVESGDWAAGCSVEQAELAIRQIAEFHATWWESPELGEMSWMPQWDMAQISQFKEMYQQGWDPFVEKIEYKLPDKILEIGVRLGKHLVSVMTYIQEPPRTIIHFDYQLDNIFFTPLENGSSLVVVDWQLITFGRGVFDVAFFLGGNIDPKDRTVKENDLLRTYHAILMETGVQDYSFDQCLYDYRLSMLYHLAKFVMLVGAIGVTPEQEHKFCDAIVPRYIAAILDLDAGEMLPP